MSATNETLPDWEHRAAYEKLQSLGVDVERHVMSAAVNCKTGKKLLKELELFRGMKPKSVKASKSWLSLNVTVKSPGGTFSVGPFNVEQDDVHYVSVLAFFAGRVFGSRMDVRSALAVESMTSSSIGVLAPLAVLVERAGLTESLCVIARSVDAAKPEVRKKYDLKKCKKIMDGVRLDMRSLLKSGVCPDDIRAILDDEVARTVHDS